MKKSLFILTIRLVLFCLIINSCSKSNSVQKTKMQLLTQSTWKYDTAGVDLNGDGTIDAAFPAGYLQDCEKDNLLTFNNDSTGTVDEGATKCNSADPQTVDFTWSFNTAQTDITSSTAIFNGVGGDITITSLTATQLHLEKAVTTSGVTVNVAIYLKH
jgi:hypothetical protein